jgi:DNA-directed RNA polymerase specialized sigma24 family protein
MSRGLIRLTAKERERAAGFARTAGLIASSVAFSSNMSHVRDELRSAAFEALSRASATYDPLKGKFPTYAWRRVMGAVLDAVRKEAKRLSLEASLDAAEQIAEGGYSATDAEVIAQIDAGTAVIMAAFAASCVASELHANGEAKLLERETLAEVERALADLPSIAVCSSYATARGCGGRRWWCKSGCRSERRGTAAMRSARGSGTCWNDADDEGRLISVRRAAKALRLQASASGSA